MRIGCGAVLLCVIAPFCIADAAKPDFKFQFGPGKTEPGYTQVLPTIVYSAEPGYGFEPGPSIQGINRNGPDALHSHFCTSDKPFFFSVRLPEGNYNVTATLGDGSGESTTTVKAELRRLMLQDVRTAAGGFVTRTFTVNVHTPAIAGGDHVHLKDREKSEEIWNWDDKLTIEFNGARPCVCALEIARADDVPTVFVMGDSTVCDQPREPWNSWGQMLTRFLKPGVAVANYAESGESLRSSLGAKRLDKVLSVMRPGDYLFIQFGHPDMKEKGEGVGAFTSYTAELKKFVSGARSKGGRPVLITSMNRKCFDSSGKSVNTLKDYPDAVRALAKEMNVPLIDLNAMSKTLYEAIGKANIDKAFVDGTHHNAYGSYELARCVIEGIRQNKLDLAKFIVEDVPAFDPSKPDPVDAFHVPASPQTSNVKPLGN